MRETQLRILTISTVSLLLLSICAISPVAAATRIYLSPSNNIYDTNTASVGQKFNVTVWVENSPDIGAWQVYLEFNDTILNVTRWFEPKTDPQYIFTGKTTSANPSPPNPGYVHIGLGRARIQVAVNLFPTPPSQPPSSGTGKLCTIEFIITAVPTEPGTKLSCVLKINSGSTYLLDPEGNEVDGVIKENGYYEISRPALPTGSRIYVDPAEIIDCTMIPCSSDFDINITIDDIANMKACEFNLTYDANVIGFIAVNFFRVNDQFPTPNMEITEPPGFIWMNLTYSSAVTVTNPAPLVTLTFHLRNLGATPLNLTNTRIIDPSGNPMAHDVYHGFFAALIRDVAVTNIMLSRTWTYAGWPVNVTVTVKNNGNVSETFTLSTYYDSSLIGTATVTSLAPNEEREILFEWDTTGISEGNYTIKAIAATVPFEMNVGDNTLVDGQIWIMTQVHDVAIVNVALSSSWVYHGWIATINVTAQNFGAFPETFDINAYYNSTLLIDTLHVDNLAPSEQFEAQFSLDTSSLLPCHTYPISAEATSIPYEYNETNNILVDGGLKVRFIGDINGDGIVDVRDVYLVSLAYGSYPGHPRWNPDADVNLDLKIDIKDVYTVSKNYGKGCIP